MNKSTNIQAGTKRTRLLISWLSRQKSDYSTTTLKRVVQLAKQQQKRGAMEVKHLRRALIDYDPPPWKE